MTADIAAGNATIGDVKCDVARTTPKEEFCIPTSIDIDRRCRSLKPQEAADMYLHMKNVFQDATLSASRESKSLGRAHYKYHHKNTKSISATNQAILSSFIKQRFSLDHSNHYILSCYEVTKKGVNHY